MPTSPLLQPVRVLGAAIGGTSTYHVVSAGSNNAAVIKAAAGTMYGWAIGSVTGVVRFVKLYDKATTPAPGSDTPTLSIEVPGNTSGTGTNFCFTPGIKFTTGIGIAVVANMTDTDNTAIGAGEIDINIFYV